MLIEREDHSNVTILKINGEMNRDNAGELRMALENLLDRHRTNIILDMEDAPFIDSAFIMMLLRMNREFLASSGGIKLLRPRSVVKRFLSIGRVLELFDLYETRVDAVRSFQDRAHKESPSDDPQAVLRQAGRRQRAALVHLIDLLQKKGYIDSKKFFYELNRSSQLVFDIFRQELMDDHPKS
ncbi:MAG: STAS domain-containing protein [Candidatus Omnitrophica bacterium]|nr:STAS domain-containing protein [Candidatus Omnitrophota bacterium]